MLKDKKKTANSYQNKKLCTKVDLVFINGTSFVSDCALRQVQWNKAFLEVENKLLWILNKMKFLFHCT